MNLKQKGRFGNTPLEMAVTYKHYKLMEFLIENGADPNIFVNDYSILHKAVQKGSDLEAVILLIKVICSLIFRI